MDYELSYKEQATENLTLQEYANLHFAGNRFQAVYELLYNSTESTLDPYIDELTQEEASFVLHLIENHVITSYGGRDAFTKAWKTETLAESLEVNTVDIHPDTPNPFAKKLKLSLWGLLGSIVFSVLASVLAPRLQMDLTFIGEILSGLCSLSVASAIISVLRFNKLKKRVAQLPSSETLEANTPTLVPFEEAYAKFLKTASPHTTMKNAKKLLKDAGKQLAVAFVFLLLLVPTTFFCIGITQTNGILACLFSCGILLGYPFWQGYMLVKCVMNSKVVGNIEDADAQTQKTMKNRQNLIALGAVIVILLYAAIAFLGCMQCIVIV